MTDPLFWRDLPADLPAVGSTLDLTGPEGRHAAVVRRIGVGEVVVLGDGAGRAVVGRVVTAGRDGLHVEVERIVEQPAPSVTITAVQALAKGDRADLALELLTEVGATRIVPWQADRSIVRWSGERQEKSLARWRSTVREAAKQSRRLWCPEVTEPLSSSRLATWVRERVASGATAWVLHEAAETWLDADAVPTAGEVIMVVGPEGGVAPAELAALTEAGATPVLINDGVLRTSTAGGVAVGILRASAPGGRRPGSP